MRVSHCERPSILTQSVRAVPGPPKTSEPFVEFPPLGSEKIDGGKEIPRIGKIRGGPTRFHSMRRRSLDFRRQDTRYYSSHPSESHTRSV